MMRMEFDYKRSFEHPLPEAYERLILDALRGDPTLFMRRDAVETSWRWIGPILERWNAQAGKPLPSYAAHDWGPPEARALIEATGRRWRTL